MSRFPLRSLRPDVGPAGLALAGVVFLLAWEALHHWFYAQHQIVDTPVYQHYGDAMRAGMLPYRDFAVEYPPAALPAFVVPTFLGSDYPAAFGWLMAACGLCCLAFVALTRPPMLAIAFFAVSPLLIGSYALSRFDLWPAAVVAAALAALVRDRHRLGWAALGIAFAIKLYAGVLVPLAAVWTLRRRSRAALALGAGIWLAVAAAAFVPFLALTPGGVANSIWDQVSRPLQVESLAASFLMTFGQPAIVASHGSLNIGGHGAVGAVFGLLPFAVLAVLWTAFARGPVEPGRLLRYAGACLCTLVALGKVLSPQFLIWLVPVVPLTRGRRGQAATAVLVAALVDTEVWFPARYFPYVYGGHLAWLVFVRDLLLVALLAVLSLPARARPRSA